MEKRSKNELVRRWFVLIISQFFIGTGIAFARRPGLGVSPISSVPHVVALKFTQISFGTWLTIWCLLLLAMQIIVLGKDFKKVQLLQIPMSMIFGFFTDTGTLIANRFPIDNYVFKILCIFIGLFILAFGICVSVACDLVLNAGEGAVYAISHRLNKKFGTVKIFFDSGNVIAGTILSLIFFNMHLEGIREGSLIAAFFTGYFVKLIMPLINDDLTKWFKAVN